MKHTLLLIDDDPLILKTLQQKLDNWDMEVYSAKNPEEAKAVMEKVTPELVLLDLLLTRDDGSSGILDFMASHPDRKHIPVIVLTNLDKPELKEMLIAKGVKEYIIKGSLSLDELQQKVLSYLEPAAPSAE